MSEMLYARLRITDADIERLVALESRNGAHASTAAKALLALRLACDEMPTAVMPAPLREYFVSRSRAWLHDESLTLDHAFGIRRTGQGNRRQAPSTFTIDRIQAMNVVQRHLGEQTGEKNPDAAVLKASKELGVESAKLRRYYESWISKHNEHENVILAADELALVIAEAILRTARAHVAAALDDSEPTSAEDSL